MRIFLAPMEGVVDHNMRDILTRIGGFDRCVTEFIRITEQRLPASVFRRICPEIDHNGMTPAGTPVYLQLLGGDPHYMALNAKTAERLGAPGIDLNFGCPSKTVNRNDGGSTLLKEPQRVHYIVKAVRDAVSADIPVTAKIRLGFADSALLDEIVDGVTQAGANELCIHARTRLDGYQPPAYWSQIAHLHQQTHLPLIVNGEIWSPEDANTASSQSRCSSIMLGRGSLCRPDLAAAIRAAIADESDYQAMSWAEVNALLLEYLHRLDNGNPKFAPSRIKQWLNYLRRHYPEAETSFQHLKRLRHLEEIRDSLQNKLIHQGETV